MKMLLVVIVWIQLASFGCTSLVKPPLQRDRVVFVDVTVLPMSSDVVLEHQTVIVDGDVISQIGPVATMKPAPGTQIVDGRGKFLIPGLGDMHTHIALDFVSAGLPDQNPDPRILLLYLVNGITTIRVPAGLPFVLQWRDKIRDGNLNGPHIFTSGPVIQDRQRWGAPTDVVTDAESAKRIVQKQFKAGYDFIKVYSQLSRPVYNVLVEEAQRLGFPVQGHVPFGPGLEGVSQSGQVAIDHAEEFYNTFFKEKVDLSKISKAVDLVANGKVKTVIPTLITYRTVVRQWDGELKSLLYRAQVNELYKVIPNLRTAWAPEFNPYVNRIKESPKKGWEAYNLMKKLVKRLHERGIRIVSGSDSPVPVVRPGIGLHEELECLVESGLTPLEALQAATKNVGEFIHQRPMAGTIREGAPADLVLLEANPLLDIRNTGAIGGVMIAGRWMTKSNLADLLANLRN